MQPRFVLGVGSAKCGTTWLHGYLRRHPQTAMPRFKEINILETHYDEQFEPFRERNQRTLRRAERRLGTITPGTPEHDDLLAEIADRARLIAMSHDLSLYPAYFQEALAKKAHSVVTGDFTPNNQVLTGVQFAEVRGLLEQAGFAVRPIYLMRDPVERIRSYFRYLQTQRVDEGKELMPTDLESMEEWVTRWQVRVRSDDAATITALEQAFRPDEIFYGFYEELFTDSEMRRLTDFLQINPEQADFATPQLQSRWPFAFSPELEAFIRSEFDGTYSFVANRFGAARIASLWYHALGKG